MPDSIKCTICKRWTKPDVDGICEKCKRIKVDEYTQWNEWDGFSLLYGKLSDAPDENGE